MIIGLNWTAFSAVGNTLSYFNDIENIAENGFSASSLDISLDPQGVYVSGLMYPTDTTATSITVSNNGSLPTQYTSEIVPLTSDTDPCDYINLDATDGTQNYSGPLLSFTSIASALDNPASWSYTFTVDPLAPPSVWDKTCYFKWVFTAWSQDFPAPSGGFIDVDEKSGGVKIGKTIVLNEILANPVGSDTALKPNGEWVELYNNSNINFDVAGWVVYDSDDSHELYITTANTNTGSTIVPAHGWLVVYRNGDSDFSINNDVETIRLYNGYPVSSSVLIDSYSWTFEKPEGFSYARIPDGVGAWVDPVPTPGGTNILEGEINDIFSELEAFYVATEEVSVTEETAPVEETITEEIAPVEEIVAVEESNEDDITQEDDTRTDAPESVAGEVQPSEEPAQNQDAIETPVETETTDSPAVSDEIIALPSNDLQDVIETVDSNDSAAPEPTESPSSSSAESSAPAAAPVAE